MYSLFDAIYFFFFSLCVHVRALGPTLYHGRRYCDYPWVCRLLVLLLLDAPVYHVPELNYQNLCKECSLILVIKFPHMVNRSLYYQNNREAVDLRVSAIPVLIISCRSKRSYNSITAATTIYIYLCISNCILNLMPSIIFFSLCVHVRALGPTPYHGCRYCDYPRVGRLPVLLLLDAPVDHVPELNYKNEGALFASVHTSGLASAVSQDCSLHSPVFLHNACSWAFG